MSILTNDTAAQLRADIMRIYQAWRTAPGNEAISAERCIHDWIALLQNSAYDVDDCLLVIVWTMGENEHFLTIVGEMYYDGDY